MQKWFWFLPHGEILAIFSIGGTTYTLDQITLVQMIDIVFGVLFLLNGVQACVAVVSVLVAVSIAALVW